MLRLLNSRFCGTKSRASASLRRSLATVVVCDDEDQFTAATKSSIGAVVYFTATWCGPCRMISPVFENLAAEKTATFLKVDVDDMPDVAAAAKVTAMPTFMFYKNGTLLDTIVGADTKGLTAGIEKHLE